MGCPEMNWRFWVKKKRSCFGYYDAPFMPSFAYLAKNNCFTCEDNQKMECFFKSLKPTKIMLGNEVDLEAMR